MTKLTEGHLEQIRRMRTDKEDRKTYQEIRDFFREKYNIKLFDCDIAAAMKGEILPKGRKSSKKSRKQKSSIQSPSTPAGTEDEECIDHIRAAFAIYKKSFFCKVAEAIQ